MLQVRPSQRSVLFAYPNSTTPWILKRPTEFKDPWNALYPPKLQPCDDRYGWDCELEYFTWYPYLQGLPVLAVDLHLEMSVRFVQIVLHSQTSWKYVTVSSCNADCSDEHAPTWTDHGRFEFLYAKSGDVVDDGYVVDDTIYDQRVQTFQLSEDNTARYWKLTFSDWWGSANLRGQIRSVDFMQAPPQVPTPSPQCFKSCKCSQIAWSSCPS